MLTPIFAIHWGLKGNTSLLEKHAVKASVGELLADFGFHRFPPKGPGSRRAQSRYNWESFMDLVKDVGAQRNKNSFSGGPTRNHSSDENLSTG